jgi:hypothetical protein
MTKLQAAQLDDRHWDADRDRLVSRLRELLPSLAEATPPSADTPRDSLEELARRAIDVLDQRTRRSPPLSSRPNFMRAVWGGAVRALKGPLTLLTVLALVYAGVHLFGDARTIAQLDALQARVLMAWDRLPGLLRQITR